MNIAILSLRSRYGDVTGDCVQAEKTAEALRRIGENAERYYLDPQSGKIYGKMNEELGVWLGVMADKDIIHTIPPIPFANILRQPKVKAKLVASSVFWSSPTYWKVVLKNSIRVDFALLRALIRELAVKFGVKLLRAKDGYDLLLPNSEDEIRCVKKYCRLKKGAKLIAVPNAIDPIPEWVENLARPKEVPDEEYLLVPGVFAPRKNQMSLIKALDGFPRPIVFIGAGSLLERCQKKASSNMIFLGHIEHGSQLFYSLMKHARVVCLPSNCETPGIAGLEAAALGARPVVPYEGGTAQYFSWDAEYLDPLSSTSIRVAVQKAWERGRLSRYEQGRYRYMTWDRCAQMTVEAYRKVTI